VFKALYPNQVDDFSLGAQGFATSERFRDVAESERQAGDLVVFPADGKLVAHVGIVVDEAHWIGSQSSTGVAKVKFSNPWWGKRKRSFRRLGSLSTTALQRGRGQWPARDIA
jgi:cell wall-associated NlpC family hydrolase